MTLRLKLLRLLPSYVRLEQYNEMYRERIEELEDDHAEDVALLQGASVTLTQAKFAVEQLMQERGYVMEVIGRLNPKVEEGQFLVVNDEAVEELQRLADEYAAQVENATGV